MTYSTLSNEAINRIIHEKVMGECWHHITNSNKCDKCGYLFTSILDKNPSYCTSWEDYGRLLEAVGGIFPYIFINKRKGCEVIAEYFCKGGD